MPLVHAQSGTEPTARYVPGPGIHGQPFSLCRTMLNPLGHTSQDHGSGLLKSMSEIVYGALAVSSDAPQTPLLPMRLHPKVTSHHLGKEGLPGLARAFREVLGRSCRPWLCHLYILYLNSYSDRPTQVLQVSFNLHLSPRDRVCRASPTAVGSKPHLPA